MRLIRSLLSLVFLALLVYFAVAVPLGSRTLWEHLKAIAGTDESKKLVDEMKRKATEVLFRDAGTASGKASPDDLTPKEQEVLRKLIREKMKGEKSRSEKLKNEKLKNEK